MDSKDIRTSYVKMKISPEKFWLVQNYGIIYGIFGFNKNLSILNQGVNIGVFVSPSLKMSSFRAAFFTSIPLYTPFEIETAFTTVSIKIQNLFSKP